MCVPSSTREINRETLLLKKATGSEKLVENGENSGG